MTFSVLELLGLILTVAVVTTLLLVLLVMFWPIPKREDRHRPEQIDSELADDAVQSLVVLSAVMADTSSCNSDSSAGSDSSPSSSCD